MQVSFHKSFKNRLPRWNSSQLLASEDPPEAPGPAADGTRRAARSSVFRPGAAGGTFHLLAGRPLTREGRAGTSRGAGRAKEAGGQAPRQLRSPSRRASSQQTSKRSLVRAWGNRVAAGEGFRCATVEVCRFHSTPHFASLEVTEIERHDVSGQKPSNRVRVPFIPP